MSKYDDFMKSVISLGVRFGQENPNKNVDKITQTVFETLMLAFKGRNPIEELVKDE